MSRLRLRTDAYVIQTDKGASILTNSGETKLTGASIFNWIDRLWPYLDGRFAIADLTAAMPPDRRTMVVRIVDTLRAKGLLLETDGEQHQNPLSEEELAAYWFGAGDPGSALTPAQSSYRAFGDSTVLLVGSGRLHEQILAAAICAGAHRIYVCATDDQQICAARLTEGATSDLIRIGPDQAHEVMAALEPADGVVIAAGDRSDLSTIRAFDLASARRALWFVAAVVDSNEAWLGPFGPATNPPAQWFDAWRRLLALSGVDRGVEPGANVAFRDCRVDLAYTVVANQLIREVVRSRARGSSATRLIRVSLDDLRTSAHRFLPHPFAAATSNSSAAELRATVNRLRTGRRLTAEEFAHQVASCVQPRVGILTDLTEQGFTQLPLAVTQVKVSDPVGLLHPASPTPVVYGMGVSLADARCTAAMLGLAAYGVLMVDPRRLHLHPDAKDIRTGDAETDLASLRAGQWAGFVWGLGVADEQTHEVPADLVFPALSAGEPPDMPPVGAAAGYDWADAVRRGLLGQFLRLTLAELLSGPQDVAPVDWRAAPLDGQGQRHRAMVNAIGLPLAVHAITGPLRVPALAFEVDGVTVSYAAGLSFTEALRDGLADVLRHYQALTAGPPEFAPAAVPPLSPSDRHARVRDWPTWCTDLPAITAGLTELGWTPVVVPLDHDPALAGIMPYLAHTVLLRG